MSKFNFTNLILKPSIFTCLVFIFIQNLNAQSPVLTAENSSLKLGDKFVFHYCKTNKFDTSGSGVNQVWDYSYLKDSMLLGTAVIDTQTCIDPKQTLYGDSFPGASIATTHTNPPGVNPHNDYWSDNTSYYYWGYYADSNHIIYTKPSAEIPLYPVSYGSTYSDSHSYIDSSFLNPLPQTMPYTYTGPNNLYADGYGTLKLPDTTIQNVLRIKSIISDSTPTTNGYIFNRRLIAYYFFTPYYHANIFALQYLTTYYSLNGVIVPFSTTEGKIIYRASNTEEVLPLQIISFSATSNIKDVFLQWQTANELNTNFFNIQRSSDGIHFNAINKVVAAGNSSNPKSYSYSDIEANELGVSKLYYRLQEVDKDGKSNYSSIKTVNLLSSHSLFSVSPNPSKDFINIISSYNISAVQVKITDMNGKTLFTGKQDFVAGQQLKVSLSKFPGEVLIVTVTGNNNNEQFKIIRE